MNNYLKLVMTAACLTLVSQAFAQGGGDDLSHGEKPLFNNKPLLHDRAHSRTHKKENRKHRKKVHQQLSSPIPTTTTQ